MLAQMPSYALVGLEPRRVEVEAHLQKGVPAFAIVGLADRACQEAKERVRSGIVSAELEWPLRRITVNLAPAELRKEGSGFDLTIALAILAASRQIPLTSLVSHAAVGELALDGRVRPVGGALVVAEGARRSGIESVICATESAVEIALAGVRPIPVRHLAEAVAYVRGIWQPEPPPLTGNGRRAFAHPDLSQVKGQSRGKRALEIAAAGRHNLLFAGPPGTGKTMLARRLPGILPPLSNDEALEVTRIHSVVGLLDSDRPLLTEPPFRAPHHSSSMVSIIGGGVGPSPGEVSLAHRGVLLLDEFPEFQRPVLEALRQPLEDGTVFVSRASGRALFPASFQLIATMNLCPCGGRGDAAGCACSPARLAHFREKLSRALIDRFDLVVAMPRPHASELDAEAGESSEVVRERVEEAHALLVVAPPKLGREARILLSEAVESLPLSGRGRARVGRVACTIAALAGAEAIGREHLAEALSYRIPRELTVA